MRGTEDALRAEEREISARQDAIWKEVRGLEREARQLGRRKAAIWKELARQKGRAWLWVLGPR